MLAHCQLGLIQAVEFPSVSRPHTNTPTYIHIHTHTCTYAHKHTPTHSASSLHLTSPNPQSFLFHPYLRHQATLSHAAHKQATLIPPQLLPTLQLDSAVWLHVQGFDQVWVKIKGTQWDKKEVNNHLTLFFHLHFKGVVSDYWGRTKYL